MSDQIKHECGIAMIRLLKPLEYYLGQYGSSFYGLQKLHLLMQKQHNRGQDGAGIAGIKLDMTPGNKYISRLRSNSNTPIKDIFNQVYDKLQEINEKHPARLNDVQWLKQNLDFTGELFMGHLRYGTFGLNSIANLHPFVRANNWMTRNLVLAGNFNMTNVDELFDKLVDLGQYPVETSDTVTVLEKIGHFLDVENERIYQKYRTSGLSKREISHKIASELDVRSILEESSQYWDGGYVITGMIGHGDAFVMRDPAGIRPAYYYADDEIVVATSERPPIQTAFNVKLELIKELKPGHALIIKKDGTWSEEICKAPTAKRSCSFERIYFSRGTDAHIYQERKMLGKLITPLILNTIDFDLKNTVFSYIPNTASAAFRGMVEELNSYCLQMKKEKVLASRNILTEELLDDIFDVRLRVDDIAVKDMKLRTFITQDNQRNDLVAHIYDVTYGVVRAGTDSLVVIDDSIVRGTTLRNSIVRILDRLEPKHIVIASSAPQIRYPDCYGIDMAKLSDFIAFRAAIALLKETRQEHIINEVYQRCKAQEKLPKEEIVNHVKKIYKPFTAEQISGKIAQMVTSPTVKSKVTVVYQTIENLHKAIPNHLGDWYFTGDYPTPGGNKVVNKSFINYIEGRDERAY
ncbi:MAG: amidophosphoribosyltransferase [Bacteroidetes bacterium HGW-Bacteroidetes-1]|jgi:amidophosphoribosyltransferase|nr:MAG: amidophosphoribosyltransferase [Bacteroidetes bacterium HGW-Bacteroidetes-1]